MLLLRWLLLNIVLETTHDLLHDEVSSDTQWHNLKYYLFRHHPIKYHNDFCWGISRTNQRIMSNDTIYKLQNNYNPVSSFDFLQFSMVIKMSLNRNSYFVMECTLGWLWDSCSSCQVKFLPFTRCWWLLLTGASKILERWNQHNIV